jgi:hypothetical protein
LKNTYNNTRLAAVLVSLSTLIIITCIDHGPFQIVLAKLDNSNINSTGAGTNTSSSQGGRSVPVETNPYSPGLDFTSVTFYLNMSDGHYHLKGLAKNTLPETRSNSIFLTIDLKDKSTDTTVKTLSGNINEPIDPGQTAPFDIDTGYTARQGNQLQFMKVMITS